MHTALFRVLCAQKCKYVVLPELKLAANTFYSENKTVGAYSACLPFPRVFRPDFRGAFKHSQLAEELKCATDERKSAQTERAGSGLKPTCSSVHETCDGVGGLRGAEKARV